MKPFKVPVKLPEPWRVLLRNEGTPDACTSRCRQGPFHETLPRSEEQLIVLETRSMPAWDSAWTVVEHMRTMDLSPRLQDHRYSVEHYTRYRLENIQLVHRALNGEEGLDADIEQSFARIDSMLKGM